MNKFEEAKFFDELASDLTKIVSDIQQNSKQFLMQIHNVSTVANKLPAVIMHRKFNLQRLIRDTLLNLDNIGQELKKTSFDCTMQSINAKRQFERDKISSNKNTKVQVKTRSPILQTIDNDSIGEEYEE